VKFGVSNSCIDNATIDDYKLEFKVIKEAGFDAVDFENFLHIKNNNLYNYSKYEFIDFLNNVKNEADKLNLKINQVHSYWDFPPTMDYTEEGLNEQINYYKKSILGAKLLGSKYLVIHERFPFGFDKEINDKKEKEFFNINVEFLKKLTEYAEEKSVILCLENLPMDIKYCKVDGVLDIINEVNSKYLMMCYDTGHANVFKNNIYEDIIKIGNKLKCLHVHDNLYGHDLHMFPYEGNIDWKSFYKGLKEINYDGIISFETAPNKKLSYETRLLGLKYLYNIGKEIMN